MRTILIALAVVTAVLAAACGGDDTTPATEGKSDVRVTLKEFEISTDADTITQGAVVFTVDNVGKEAHELKIIKTDLKPEALTAKADGSVDEAAFGTDLVGKTDAVPAGQSQSLSTKLKAGNYVLISNTVRDDGGQTKSDYREGMRTAFTVK
jgi:major membrane immunogen (membrane-anchored lipoprotein)